MERPDFIKTEWKDKGGVEVHFLNSKIINVSSRSLSSQLDSIIASKDEPTKSFCEKKVSYTNENHMLTNTMAQGTFSVQCVFSTLNIWEYEAKSNPHLTHVDLSLHDQVPIEDTERKNIDEMPTEKFQKSDSSEDHKHLNEKCCSSLTNSENVLLNDVMHCYESNDMEMDNEIVSKMEYEAKSNPHLTNIDLSQHDQVSVEDTEGKNLVEIPTEKFQESDSSEDHKHLNEKCCSSLMNSENILINDVMHCYESKDMEMDNAIASKMEYEANRNPHLTNIDLNLQNQVPVEDTKGTEGKNIDQMPTEKFQQSNSSEGHKYINEKCFSGLTNYENILINDVMHCYESKDMKMSKAIASKVKHKAKINSCSNSNNPAFHPGGVAWALQYCQKQGLTSIQMQGLNSNQTQGLNANQMQGFEANQMQGLNANQMQELNANQMQELNANQMQELNANQMQELNANQMQELNANQMQELNANQMQEYANNDCNKIYKAEEKKISYYIINNVYEFFNIVWFSVNQLMQIFDFRSVISALYARIYKGSISEKDKKISLEINRMEVKALKSMRSSIGNLIKVYPRTPLLCENNGMIVQKVKLGSKHSIPNRGRIDELIRISSESDLTLEKESNISSGLYVTYLSQQDVQYILDQQQMMKTVLHDDVILQPFETEFKYVPTEGQFMPYHRMISKVVQDLKLLQFIEDPSFVVGIPPEIPKSIENYWIQRHRLFIRYDDGICLDEESWYSVTPEIIAAHQAQRCTCDTVIDAFCGAGGNAIQLAAVCNKVIAIDIDPKKIELAQNNARVYGVLDRIEFIVGDFLELAPNLKGDVVFMSPPWGGMSYNKDIAYDIFQLDGNLNGQKIFEAASTISNDIALFLPKSANIFQAILLAGPDGRVDLEYAHISNKRKGLTAYYGNLVDFNYDEEEY